MSVAGFSKKPFKYIPISMREEKNPPEFTIRRLTRLEVSEIVMETGGGEETFEVDATEDEGKQDTSRMLKFKYSMLHQQIKVTDLSLRKAVSGWKNVNDEDGNPIPFNVENIDCLDEIIADELFSVTRGGVTKEDVKNSEPLSVSESA